MTDEFEPATPLVDAFRHSGGIAAAEPKAVSGTSATRPAHAKPPRYRSAARRRVRPTRRTVRIALLLILIAVGGWGLVRAGGPGGLVRRADSAASQLASGNSTAASALDLLGFGRIRSAAGLPPICDARHPSFLYGFATLRAQVGARMGDPLECERAIHPSGDTHQLTTTGLAYYRKGVNIPSFVQGLDHWALTDRGLVHWIGDVVDPPGAAAPSSSADD